MVCVPGAKVPIVKIWDPDYQVACDINVNSTLALDNTKMIKTYVEIDDRVRPLAMIIKYWTKQRVLNDAGESTVGFGLYVCFRVLTIRNSWGWNIEFLHMDMHDFEFPSD